MDQRAFRNGKAYICQNPLCKKKFYKWGYATSQNYRNVYANTEEELNSMLDAIELEGEWRRDGEPTHYEWSGQWCETMRRVSPVKYGPFFHSQSCMYHWIGENIPQIYNILLAQNRNSVNIPE